MLWTRSQPVGVAISENLLPRIVDVADSRLLSTGQRIQGSQIRIFGIDYLPNGVPVHPNALACRFR